MATGQPMSWKPDEELREQVERYQDRRGHDYLSDAQEELVRIGLQEGRSPIMHRVRDQTVDSAFNLSQIALVTVVAGYTTDVLAPPHSVLIAVVLLSLAAALLAAGELVRTLGGHSHLRNLLPVRWS